MLALTLQTLQKLASTMVQIKVTAVQILQEAFRT